jgi:hypothetical protein
MPAELKRIFRPTFKHFPTNFPKKGKNPPKRMTGLTTMRGLLSASLALVCLLQGTAAFVGQSAFLAQTCAKSNAFSSSSRSGSRQVSWRMGKQAAFGPFTPVVVAARSVIGEKKFNQIRGKVIVFHSSQT